MSSFPFNSSAHKTILFQILRDIYADTAIAPFLGFKGGTAAFLFYGLSRFSVDLDFDLLDESKEDEVFARVERIVKKYGQVREQERKRFSLLFILSYEDRVRRIKIEISHRKFGSRYELKTYLGISMLVMVRADMFAHKLMAMHERIGKTSRDIYDVWFFLEKRWPINRKIVEQRSHVSFRALTEKCIHQLEKMNNSRILDGLGDLLSASQKDRIRTKLRTETIFLLKMRFKG